MIKGKPTAQEFLRDSTASKEVENPRSSIQQTVKSTFLSISPKNLRVIIHNFTQPGILRALGHSVLYSGLPDYKIMEQIERPLDLSRIKPGDLLLFQPPRSGYGDTILTESQIVAHTKGLLSRKDAVDDEDFKYNAFFGTLLKISKIDLRQHMKDLFALQKSFPASFIFIIEDQIDLALQSLEESMPTFANQISAHNTIFRHWLLHRASYLQLTASFIVSLSIAQTPRLLRPFLRRGDVSANAAMAWVDVLGSSSTAALKGHSNYSATGVDAGSPGVKPLPQRVLSSVLKQFWFSTELNVARKYNIAILRKTGKMLALIPGIVALPRARIAEALEQISELHVAAGVFETSDSRRVTLFSMWTGGLTQTTMLLGNTIRYLEAVHIANQYIGNLHAIRYGECSKPPGKIKSRGIVDVAEDIAAHLMGDWAPKLLNTDKAVKLGRAYAESLKKPLEGLEHNPALAEMRVILDPFAVPGFHKFL